MTVLLILIITVVFIFLSKLFFEHNFNHVSIYSFVWGGMLFLYELKLLKYIDLTTNAWFIIIVSYLIFFLGAITPLFIFDSVRYEEVKKTDSQKNFGEIFRDKGKALSIAVYILGSISLISAFHTWYILFNIYGSIVNILMSANEIYRMRVDSEIPGIIPYLGSFAYAGIFLAGIYTAYKSKLTIPVFITILGAILRDMAVFARIGILISLIIFILSFMLYRNFVKQFIKVSKAKLIPIFLISVILIVVSTSMVRIFRGSYESYKVAEKELSAFKSGLIISPSVYLYLSSHIGVFSKYLDEEAENTKFGENTLAPVYNLLAKFGIAEKSPFHQRGYYIPMWTNSSTYLRELHSDFGFLGIFIVPYLLSFISTVLWRKFYKEGNIYVYLLLVFFFSIVSLSFFSLIIRSPDWYFAFIILSIVIPLIKRANYNIDSQIVL